MTISDLGVPTTSDITFIYEQEKISGYLTVYYTDEGGAALANPETIELAPGDHTITPNPALIPAGYILSATSQSQFDHNCV